MRSSYKKNNEKNRPIDNPHYYKVAFARITDYECARMFCQYPIKYEERYNALSREG